jgi:molecular chaperone GrpE
MTEHDREEDQKTAERRVKVTDKRRVHADESQPESAQQPGPEPGDEAGDELEAARKQSAEYLDHLQRLQAEFANYRKRVLKEQTRAVELASEPLVRRFLEVLDEFDLALMAAEQKPDFDKFLHGVELVYAKLKEILGGEGLERIEAEGKPFDPEHHEALMQSGHADGDPIVDDILRQGYTLKGRVIRPAGVKVLRR